MKFAKLSRVFDRIERVSGRLETTKLLADLLQHADPDEISIIAYLSLGQLHPPYIGTQFNIAEKLIIAFVAEFLDVEHDHIKSIIQQEGDIGSVIAQHQWDGGKEFELIAVYDQLSAIEKTSGTGSQEQKKKMLTDLVKDLDPLSAKYVIRIILGKLRLGFSDMTFLDALSWMETGNKSLRGILEDAYNVCADLGTIARMLKKGGTKAVESVNIMVGIPIRPAAAERLPTAKAVIEKIGACVVQPKLDGFRLQIHVKKENGQTVLRFFSRNLQDMSDMFPDLVTTILQLDADSIIVEGEAIGYDPNTGNFLPFQETVKRKRKHNVEGAVQDFPLKLFLFDLLYLNGMSCLQKKHSERRKLLEKVVLSIKGDQVQIISQEDISTTAELESYFTKTISDGLEGIVVKRPEAIYQPGKRNFNWIKLKRQQEGQLDDTIDAIILGYYAGKGKRASFGIGAFLVGVYNKENDSFQTVAKIGTGLTDAEWQELKTKMDALKVLAKPNEVACPKELVPDVWVSPELVCIVRADEITVSPLHTAGKTDEFLGFALRFPRFMGYRDDKSKYDATTAQEIIRLYNNQFTEK